MADSHKNINDNQLFTDELFRQVPVCLWVEDFSEVHEIIHQLKADGITDFSRYFDQHPEVIEKCAKAVKVLDVNQATVDLHKAGTREKLLENIQLTFTEKSLQLFGRELITLIGDDSGFSSNTELLTLDGQLIFCVIKSFVDPNFDSWSRVYVAITDITPIKTAEKALRDNEAHFRDLYDRAPTGYQSLDQGGCFLHANQTMLNLLGYESDEVIGHWFGEFLIPEDQPGFKTKFPHFISKGHVEGVRFRMVRKDRSILHVEFDGRIVLGPAGEFQRTHCVMRDVTEKFELEKARDALTRQNELILLTAGDGILGIDVQGKIDFANPEVAKMTGWSVAELLGQSEHWLLHHSESDGRPIPEHKCAILIPVREGRPTRGKCSFWRKDGTSFPIEFNCQPILVDGISEGAVLTFRDIAERESLERQLALSQKLEAVGQLAGGLAHDFNNILQVMMGEAELSLDGTSTHGECRQSLRSIKDGILKASGLTRQLLAFGRCQVLDKKVEAIDALVENILRMLYRLVPEDVEISFAPAAGDVLVLVDVGQIEQVLVNLCINARDAMRHGGKLQLETDQVVIDSLFIDVHPWARKGSFARITVSDTGCGMDQETLSQIFEPFFTTKGEESGTGLGLATAYGIIKQHGGFIHAYSEPGLGTTFRVYLPVSTGAEKPELATSVPTQFVGGNETILLAEDDPSVREGFRKILEQAGYKVLLAKDGLEALELNERHPGEIQLAVLDVVMPKFSGPEVFKILRKIDKDLPVIFCSGYSRNLLNGHLLEDRGVVLLDKPLGGNLLLQKIRELLDAFPR